MLHLTIYVQRRTIMNKLRIYWFLQKSVLSYCTIGFTVQTRLTILTMHVPFKNALA